MRGWQVWLLFIVVSAGLPAWAGEAYACAETRTPKFLDGRFTEWHEPTIVLDGWCWRAEAGATPIYGGPLDCSATVRLAWDAKRLYLAIAVVDDALKPAKKTPADTGDAVILRFVGDAKDAVPTEFVLAWGSPVTLQRREADGTLGTAPGALVGAARATLPLPVTPLPRETGKPAPTSITKAWYEVALPWTALPGLTPKRDATFGLEVQVLDRDGDALRGRLRWHGAPAAPRVNGLGAVRLTAPLPAAPKGKKLP